MTTKIETPEKSNNFDPDEAQEAFGELIDILQKHRLTIAELVIVLGNLSYTVGASIEGFKDKGPSEEELKRLYYSEPSVGVALMLSGLTTCAWFDQLGKGEKQ